MRNAAGCVALVTAIALGPIGCDKEAPRTEPQQTSHEEVAAVARAEVFDRQTTSFEQQLRKELQDENARLKEANSKLEALFKEQADRIATLRDEKQSVRIVMEKIGDVVRGIEALNSRQVVRRRTLMERQEKQANALQSVVERATREVSTVEARVRDLNAAVEAAKAEIPPSAQMAGNLTSRSPHRDRPISRSRRKSERSLHELWPRRSQVPSQFAYHGKIYANFQEFKTSADFAEYRRENEEAAARFNQYLLDKERRQQAAVDFFCCRHRFSVSTRVLTDENDRWRRIARAAQTNYEGRR